MDDLQKNIVPSANQNADNYYEFENTGLRVLFVGNSITLHAPKPSIGWHGNWGMAASSLETDYVHRVVAGLKKHDPNLAYAISQVSDFERRFETMDVTVEHKRAIDFKADIIIMFFGANVRKSYEDECDGTFTKAYKALRDALVGGRENVKVFHSEGFYKRPWLELEKLDAVLKSYDTYITLGDIKNRVETHGMHNHPNDQGMKEIADLFLNHILYTLK